MSVQGRTKARRRAVSHLEVQIAPSDIFLPARWDVRRAGAGAAARGCPADRTCGSRALHPVRLETHGLRSAAGLRASACAHRPRLCASSRPSARIRIARNAHAIRGDQGGRPVHPANSGRRKCALVQVSSCSVRSERRGLELALCVFRELWRRNDVLPRRCRLHRADRRWQLVAAISMGSRDHGDPSLQADSQSIAYRTGHRGTDACILSTPLSLEELDRKSSEFCPDDRAALVAAGVLKEKEEQNDPSCMTVAGRLLVPMLVTARRMLDDWWATLH